jgi:hypothetical protein
VKIQYKIYSTCKKIGSTGRIGFSAPLQPLIPDEKDDDVIGRESARSQIIKIIN